MICARAGHSSPEFAQDLVKMNLCEEWGEPEPQKYQITKIDPEPLDSTIDLIRTFFRSKKYDQSSENEPLVHFCKIDDRLWLKILTPTAKISIYSIFAGICPI